MTTTDPMGNESHHTFDALGRVSTITDPLNGVTSIAYDDIGNISSITNAEGGMTYFSYVTDIIGLIRKALNFKGFANWSYFYCSRGAKLSEGGQVELGLN